MYISFSFNHATLLKNFFKTTEGVQGYPTKPFSIFPNLHDLLASTFHMPYDLFIGRLMHKNTYNCAQL